MTEIVRDDIVYRSWYAGPDAADVEDYIRSHFLGVWFGRHTPYLLTTTRDFLGEIRRALVNPD